MATTRPNHTNLAPVGQGVSRISKHVLSNRVFDPPDAASTPGGRGGLLDKFTGGRYSAQRGPPEKSSRPSHAPEEELP
ncbi:MAG: hypothetical protein JW719_07700 [Pirellulales bacterium]|nr:hypothetical protein [Pirellulales bacterium]